MNARRPLTAARPALLCILLAVAASCSDPAAPSPDGVRIRADKPGSPGPDPDPQAVQPPEGDQGQTLDVIITGTDFGEPGEVCEVNWLIDGVESSAIQTNAAACASTEQIEANITIEPDAPAEQLYDVQVYVGRGRGRRGGVGSELFHVNIKPQECHVHFDLTLHEAKPVRSDRPGQSLANRMYQSNVDRVEVFTGSGDGFRFDTNGSQKIEWKTDKRWAILDFRGTGFESSMETDEDGNPVPRGIDMRFRPHSDGTQLNLCALDVGTSDDVPMGMGSIALGPDSKGVEANTLLMYSGVTGDGSFDCGVQPDPFNPGQTVQEVTVSRVDQDTWQLVSGPTACLLTGPGNDLQFLGVVQMPFTATIVAQP